jgi:hypothetical protein
MAIENIVLIDDQDDTGGDCINVVAVGNDGKYDDDVHTDDQTHQNIIVMLKSLIMMLKLMMTMTAVIIISWSSPSSKC